MAGALNPKAKSESIHQLHPAMNHGHGRYYCNYLDTMANHPHLSPEEIRHRTCLVTTTCYPDTNDIRLLCAVDLCRLAAQHNFQIFIIDDSPDEMVRRQLRGDDASLGEYVHAIRQDKAQYSGKGGALRQAIRMAAEWFRENNIDADKSAIVFTEPEKTNIIEHVYEIVFPLLTGNTDVVVPARNDDLFRETYPIEQYHSESYGNFYFNLLANQCGSFEWATAEGPTKKLDWLFGPFAFKMNLANSWLQYEGTAWDAQMVPYVRGVRMNGWRITSVPINYRHSRDMKQQEEGDPIWVAKRLHQLNLLFDLLGKRELAPYS